MSRDLRVTSALRLAFLALLVVLVVHNVSWMAEDQRELSCRLRVWCTKPRDLGRLAATNGSQKIRATDAIFIDLGNRIPGARLTIPAWMNVHHWDLTHVSRLLLTVSDEPMLVDPLHLAELEKGAEDVSLFMRRGGSNKKRLLQQLYFLIEEGVDEYVIAQEKATEGGALFVMPAARYEEMRLR